MKKKEKKQIIDSLHNILDCPSSEVSEDKKEEIRKIIILIDHSKTKEDKINWTSQLINFFKIASQIADQIDST